MRMRRAVVVKGRGRHWMKSNSLLVKLGRRFYRVPHPPQQGIPGIGLQGPWAAPSRSRPVGSRTTRFTHGLWGSPVLILNVVTPHFKKVRFSLSPVSGLAFLPSPLTQWGPPPNSCSAKGKINSISKLPVPLGHVWAKAAS